MLHFYMGQYNETINRMQQLYRNLDQINDNINRIYFGTNTYNNSNNNSNRFPRDNRYSYRNRSRNDSSYYRPLRANVPIVNNNNNRENGTNNVRDNLIFEFIDVPVIPTHQQVLSSTRLVHFDTILDPLNETCPISLERFADEDLVTQIIFCGHLFNTEQLNNWFASNVRCPVCRYDIRNYVNTSSNTVEEEEKKEEELSTSLSSITQQLLHNLLQTESEVGTDRFYYDASNNAFLFETTLFYGPRNNGNPNP